MGKKTIRVPFSEDASIAAFSQNQFDLLQIYQIETALDGIWGVVLVPLHGDGYFYYRKDLGDGTMLICGECYACSTEKRFREELGSYSHEHRNSDIGFIEEDSLVDDDGDFDLAAYKLYKEEEDILLMEQKQATPCCGNIPENSPQVNTPPAGQPAPNIDPAFRIPEIRAYVVDWEQEGARQGLLHDEEFMIEAERQGTVYTLKGFQAEFNQPGGAIDSDRQSVRFFTV